ncbi:hypothetical protein EV294_10887 [Paenibacillus sp. BK033]|nr:hypothetical protein EV294_10887 [Paenibacillus sp. BK033]
MNGIAGIIAMMKKFMLMGDTILLVTIIRGCSH